MLKRLAQACATLLILAVFLFSLSVPALAQEAEQGVDYKELLTPLYEPGCEPGGSAEGTAACACGAGEEAGNELPGRNNKEKIWNFLVDTDKGMGFSNVQAAGIMGNIQQESGFSPTALNDSSGAYGIVQWYAERRTALESFARANGKAPSNLKIQLLFLKLELDGDYKSTVTDPIKATDNLEVATRIWLEIFERPCLPGSAACIAEMRIRLPNAMNYLALYGSGDSTGGADSDISCGAGDNGAFVNSAGYAWPVGLGKADVSAGYPLPCRTGSCHHDGSAAFDLAHKDTVGGDLDHDSKSAGVPVYAIRDGEIYSVKIYQGIAGCYAIQFKASDGFVYWYGHLQKPVARTAGKKFEAGYKIAEIGLRKCTGNGSYPHLHIDRGSPKGALGGSVGSRDAGMNNVINELYRELP